VELTLLERAGKLWSKIFGGSFPEMPAFLSAKSEGGAMKKLSLVLAVLLVAVGVASAATTQKFTAGWDNFGAQLNYKLSHVTWSVNSTTKKVTITYKLVGAVPTSLYQMTLNFYCTTFPLDFGQFPTDGPFDGTCTPLTRQGVTKDSAETEIGVVLTDKNGNGSVTVVIGPVSSGTYDVTFFVRNEAGCNVNGGGGSSGTVCEADFQSPGPYGTPTTIVVP
jgi:hypothetical protein